VPVTQSKLHEEMRELLAFFSLSPCDAYTSGRLKETLIAFLRASRATFHGQTFRTRVIRDGESANVAMPAITDTEEQLIRPR